LRYPHWKPDGRPVHPLLVTMDNWNLFTHTTHGELFDLVRADLDRRGIDHAIVAEHQYVICSANEFELAIQVMQQIGLHAIIGPLNREEKLGWQISGHLRQSFARELTLVVPLFPKELLFLLPASPAGA
jgi:hypothetical protein